MGACGGTASAEPRSTPSAAAAAGAADARTLAAAQLLAGLLSPDAVGHGFLAQAGYPKSTDSPIGSLADTGTAPCRTVIDGGGSIGSQSEAHTVLGRKGDESTVAKESVAQFSPGDATTNLAGLGERFADNCASYTSTLDDGTLVKHKVTVARPRLGDEALLLGDLYETATAPRYSVKTLDVRYRDVVVSVTYLGDAATVDAYDFQGQVKAIAAKLGVG